MSGILHRRSTKILVLGDSGVGKSSLVNLICHSSILSAAQWTIGCSIDVKIFENNFLEFWEIGGSRSHKIASSFLYQDYHGIIVVFDATNKKSRSNLGEWVIDATREKSNDDNRMMIGLPILTIATKKDLVPYIDETMTSDKFFRSHNNHYSSVVNITNDNPPSDIFRRHVSSGSLAPSSSACNLLTSSLSSLSSSSFPSKNLMSPSLDESLVENQVIYVNTQDALSFESNNDNCRMLNGFFKRVIDRQNRIFYNKFAI